MSRALGETVIQDTLGNIISGCTIDLLDPISGLRLTVPVYADQTSASTLTLPFVSPTGTVSFYLAIGQLVTVQATNSGITATETIAVTDPTTTTGNPTGNAGGDLAGSTYPNPVVAPGAVTAAKTDGSILVTGVGAQVKTGTLQTPLILPNNVRFWDGAGVPSNATGANGDVYFRSDGAGTATIYQRVAGVWQLVALPAPPTGAAGGDLAGSTYPNPVVAALAITTGKIAANAVTAAKLGAAAATGAALGSDVALVGHTHSEVAAPVCAFIAPVAADEATLFQADEAVTVTKIAVKLKGGTSTTVQIVKNENGTPLNLLASALSNATPGTWVSTTTLQNNTLAATDDLTAQIVTSVGNPTEIDVRIEATESIS